MTARILIAMLCLLAFATSDAAECAWVLWMERPTHSNQWSLSYSRSAYETKKECDQDAKNANDGEMRAFLEASKIENVQKYGVPQPTGLYTCLPDTVDPRGPKGGGR